MKNLHQSWSNWKLVLHNPAILLLKDDMYFNLDKLYSHNGWIIAMIIGERGVGKSFASKRHVMNRFLKYGEQFIYLRRYKTELDTSLATFFDDLRDKGYFVDHDLEVVKSKMLTKFLCDGKVCGYAVPLSTSNILKSTSFPKVATIIYDEYMLDNSGTYR
ncbi:MAG: phage DNA encapsidation protein, partial [Bacteroidales bacterium]|nr:phage DNA encapsidation protein [Bacteroidales bacterium]